MENLGRDVLVSIVSHGHGTMLRNLLDDLALPGNAEFIRVILTLNIPEGLDFSPEAYPFPVQIVRNDQPKGFSANHNQAFHIGNSAEQVSYFCVLNPDIRMPKGVLMVLRERLGVAADVALVAPAVVNPTGVREDSARPLPTPWELALKAWGVLSGRPRQREPEPGGWYWLAGMFMLFDASIYARLNGFDERYALYYEDVDLCCRLALVGHGIELCPDVSVIHDARRDSRRRLKYFVVHLRSIGRFFSSRPYRDCRRWLKENAA